MPKINLLDNDSFESLGKATLLEELEAQNLDVNYNCRSGFCGACRVKLVKGEVETIQKPVCRLAEDEILSCCSRANEDVELAFDQKVNLFQSAYSLTI